MRRLQNWKTIRTHSETIFNEYLKIELHDIRLPNGRVIIDWPWINTPDCVNIFAETIEGKYIILQQTKYAISDTSYASVGGFLAPSETPLEAAKRELLEETGYEATKWEEAGKFVVDGNRGMGSVYLFIATGAFFSNRMKSDDLEDSEVLLLSLDELKKSLVMGKFKVLPWMATISFGINLIEIRNLAIHNS